MLTNVIMLLIQLCVLALVVYLILYVLEAIGLSLPAQVVKIIWVIAILIAVYVVLTGLGGFMPGRGVLTMAPFLRL